MANHYRVHYTTVLKIGTGKTQLRTATETKTVDVYATSETNAIAAAKAADPRNSNANIEYCEMQCMLHCSNLIAGS